MTARVAAVQPVDSLTLDERRLLERLARDWPEWGERDLSAYRLVDDGEISWCVAPTDDAIRVGARVERGLWSATMQRQALRDGAIETVRLAAADTLRIAELG